MVLVVPEMAVVGGDEVLSMVSDIGAGSDDDEDVVMESEDFCGLDVLEQDAAIHYDKEVGTFSNGEFLVWSGIKGGDVVAVGPVLVFLGRDFWICQF